MRVTMIATFLLSVSIVPVAHTEQFIGSEQCGECHTEQLNAWKKTAHSRAHLKLNLTQRRDPRCGTCHNTDTALGFLGVQCESCHGPGAGYWKKHGSRRAANRTSRNMMWDAKKAEVCGHCHDSVTLNGQPFDLSQAMQRLTHCRTAGGEESK